MNQSPSRVAVLDFVRVVFWGGSSEPEPDGLLSGLPFRSLLVPGFFRAGRGVFLFLAFRLGCCARGEGGSESLPSLESESLDWGAFFGVFFLLGFAVVVAFRGRGAVTMPLSLRHCAQGLFLHVAKGGSKTSQGGLAQMLQPFHLHAVLLDVSATVLHTHAAPSPLHKA